MTVVFIVALRPEVESPSAALPLKCIFFWRPFVRSSRTGSDCTTVPVDFSSSLKKTWLSVSSLTRGLIYISDGLFREVFFSLQNCRTESTCCHSLWSPSSRTKRNRENRSRAPTLTLKRMIREGEKSVINWFEYMKQKRRPESLFFIYEASS